MDYLKSMLADGTNGTASSKRVIALLAYLLWSVAFVSELFWWLKVSDHTLEAMMYVVIAGLGFTASEKFSKETK